MRGGEAALLPPTAPGWPVVLVTSAAAPDATAEAALMRIRTEALFWPTPRAGAARTRCLALSARDLTAARAVFDDADILCAEDPADVEPGWLEAVFGPADASAMLWARIGGLATPCAGGAEEAVALLARARGVSPWGGGALSLSQAVEAQALLRAAALRARGPVALIGMSRWKRRCLKPFLTGADGPPRAASDPAGARARGWRPVFWGADPRAEPDDLRVEDGFLRSVGLGLRHVPPMSLAIQPGAPHFDATCANAFDATIARAAFTPALRARAQGLRAEIVALGLTKYNLDGAPIPYGRGGAPAILVPGQVESDASIRLGAGRIRTNLALLEHARARWPRARILYKPHPDVMTGLRSGAVPPEAVARLADGVIGGVATSAALDWTDRVVTMTSLIGFEALLRGKAVETVGRPFYAGWGLTDDLDPPPRPRSLTLDELVAAALILHASYVDPETGLPAPPEIALRALACARARSGAVGPRLRRSLRNALSWALNRF